MQIPAKSKIFILVGGLLIVIVLLVISYNRGKRVGKVTSKMTQTRKEINLLEEDKIAIHKEVHALDHDALHTRILELSERVHKQARAR